MRLSILLRLKVIDSAAFTYAKVTSARKKQPPEALFCKKMCS